MAEQLLNRTNIHPRRMRCVAKLCRNVWAVTRFVTPASFAARVSSRLIMISCR